MVVAPDRVPPTLVRGLGDIGHRLVLLDRILDLGKVHPPALRHEDAKSNCHGIEFKLQQWCGLTSAARRPLAGIGARSTLLRSARPRITLSRCRTPSSTGGGGDAQRNSWSGTVSGFSSSGARRNRFSARSNYLPSRTTSSTTSAPSPHLAPTPIPS